MPTIAVQILDDLRKASFRLFVEVGHGDAGSEYSIVGMLGGKVSCCFCREILEGQLEDVRDKKR